MSRAYDPEQVRPNDRVPQPDRPWGRPYVTLNVAPSADGKLAPIDGGKVNFGGPEDRAANGSV